MQVGREEEEEEGSASCGGRFPAEPSADAAVSWLPPAMLRLLLPLAALAALLRAAVSARLASPSARDTRGQRGAALTGAGAGVAEGGLVGASSRRWGKALRLGPFLNHERFGAHGRRAGRGCRACGSAEGEIPEPGQGEVLSLLPSRPARSRPAVAEEGLAVPPSGGDGRRGHPAGAVLPAPGLPARPGIVKASLSSPGRWGNRYRPCR